MLITLDTTRADFLGCYGARDAETPFLDRLAARGTRWSQALSPAVLTLPAHATLLTGLLPPEHGVRDNGDRALPPDVPTLAEVLAARGYRTAAFVSSRVLDRRFGLARGFAVYDDHMVAEHAGEHGYPERSAADTTRAAIEWLRARPSGTAAPFFLWVHYYDPHAPYDPPRPWRGGSLRANYAGEITAMDRELGRLLAALPGGAERHLIAVAGDHGEALGEHGEGTHGIFVYQASLHVPLILAGPGVAAGAVVEAAISTRGLAPELLDRLGHSSAKPGLASSAGLGGEATIYSETMLPHSAYGWAPLAALTRPPWRYIEAPRPELYDLASDPAEAHNLIAEAPERARMMAAKLASFLAALGRREAPSAGVDPELAAQLRSLGYAAGGGVGKPRGDGIDPKDGILLLAEAERAGALIDAGQGLQAMAILEQLVRKNRSNVQFAALFGRAATAAGEHGKAVSALRRAAELDPDLELLHVLLGDALRRAGRKDEAATEYRLALGLDPRLASAHLGLVELAESSIARRKTLAAAIEAGAESAQIHAQLAEHELAAHRLDSATEHAAKATELLPEWAPAWLLRGRIAIAAGQRTKATPLLSRAAQLAPGSEVAAQAAALIAEARAGG